jgi:hypothetical protein
MLLKENRDRLKEKHAQEEELQNNIKRDIEIPMNAAGKRCCEVFVKVALELLHQSREATENFIKSTMPEAEFIDEKAMNGGKYTAMFALPGGNRQRVTYDYRTKAIVPN